MSRWIKASILVCGSVFAVGAAGAAPGPRVSVKTPGKQRIFGGKRHLVKRGEAVTAPSAKVRASTRNPSIRGKVDPRTKLPTGPAPPPPTTAHNITAWQILSYSEQVELDSARSSNWTKDGVVFDASRSDSAKLMVRHFTDHVVQFTCMLSLAPTNKSTVFQVESGASIETRTLKGGQAKLSFSVRPPGPGTAVYIRPAPDNQLSTWTLHSCSVNVSPPPSGDCP